MSLLVDLSSSALDPGYAAAAQRRTLEGAAERHDRRGRPLLALAVVAATLLIVIAAVQAHVRAPAAARTRADLVRAVQQQNQAVDALARRVDSLRAEVTRLRDQSIAGTAFGDALSAQIRQQELVTGATAVTGPGVRVTLDDAPAGGSSPRNRVLDRDLQAVANALWAAGAEAIAINGQRLTAQSAIRQAGDAVLVDFQPLSPPYRVEAIGDPVAVETGFASSEAAARLRSYTQLYGLRFDYSRQPRLRLPAAAEETLNYAHPIPSPTRGGTP